MKNNYVMRLNENLLWLSILVLGILSYLKNTKYVVILIFWVVIIISVGNAKRVYSKKYIITSTVIRRSLYVIPFLLPIIIDFEVSIKTKNLVYWCIAGMVVGIMFILPKLNEWRLVLSKDMIEFTSKKNRVDYITQIYMLLGAAIGEEIFFRNFIIGYIDNSSYVFLVILSCSMFFLNHFGVKWNNHFKKQDYIIQIVFGSASAVLFILSKSVLPSIIAHSVFNAPLMLLALKSCFYHYNKNKLFENQNAK
ncbi:CPBP family intramembrane glutamic endopeptidase [Abyssisolibacter fermentans]|uniref:CPBP family intramembrane glutamic endopeptidase n=1 Tax=Abyssisolibacter fermentans TaxID=1766203 RepID=UPI00082D0AC2|nr:CPBP family intramembrane glutamic endopeptidase [Abyssisolibacter fermentans]